MKKVLLALFLLPLFSVAQDTCGLKKSKDPFTNVEKLSTGFKSFGTPLLPVSISADATPTDIDFFIWVKKPGTCFDLESEVMLTWEGERSKTTFHQTGSINCEGAFHFTFKNSATPASWLRKMAAKKIATIKLTGNGGKETVLTLTEEQKTTLQRMAICISAEGPELIKK